MEENAKPSMSFTDSLFAAVGMDDEEEEVKEEPPTETTLEEECTPSIEEESNTPTSEEESAPAFEEEIIKTEIPGVIGEIYKVLGSSSAFAVNIIFVREIVQLLVGNDIFAVIEVVFGTWPTIAQQQS